MPVVAVLGAVAIDGFALAGGIAAMSTLTAITAIGATVGAIGAVTHNKTLSLIGAGLGIVGGIGSLALGTDALGSVGDLFGSSSAAADSASISNFANAGMDAATESVNAGTAGLINADTANIATAADSINPVSIMNSSQAASEGSVPAIETGGDTNSVLGKALTSSDTASVSAEGAPRAYALESGADATSGTGEPPTSQYNSDLLENGFAKMSADSPPGGVMAWAKNNQLLSYGVLQAGGSFISGLTNPMTPAQIDSLNSQAEVNRATAALIQRQTANQGAPLPTLAAGQVTGAPERQSGLINNAPIRTPLITGIPNTGPGSTQFGTGAA